MTVISSDKTPNISVTGSSNHSPMDPPLAALRCMDPPHSTQQSMESGFYYHLSAWIWIAKGIKTDLATQEEVPFHLRESWAQH